MDNLIIIDTKENLLKFVKNNKILLQTKVLIGKNGATYDKEEGDLKTPLGIFEIGIIFGIHDRNVFLHNSLKYIKINENLYWVDDVNSKYYNNLVDIQKTERDFKSAEHLIDYLIEYEYAIEIKTNPNNIKGKGSAIFIHCSNNKKTSGCVSIPREKMIELIVKINKRTKIIIK